MLRRTPLLTLSILVPLALSGSTFADILEVPTDYPTIQQAVDNALPGDEVVILPGTYVENVQLFAQMSLVIRGAADAALTIVDGNSSGPVFYLEDCHRIAIRNLTIRGGGAGVKIENCDPVQVADCIIQDNHSLGDGGGISARLSHVLVEDNQILDNSANVGANLDGGGIFFWHCSGVIARNRIERNRGHEAAGLSLNGSTDPSLIVSENLIIDNLALLFGGGMFINVNTHPEILSNTMVGNTATSAGGAIFYMPGSAPVFARNIIADNSAADGGGVHAFGLAAPAFTCNDAWENAGGNYTGDLIDPTGTDGNISLDPLFCNPGGGDYSISQLSPCAPGNSPAGCDLIGAVPVGCGPIAVEPATWGSIKGFYSPREEGAQ
jgi:serine protease